MTNISLTTDKRRSANKPVIDVDQRFAEVPAKLKPGYCFQGILSSGNFKLYYLCSHVQ